MVVQGYQGPGDGSSVHLSSNLLLLSPALPSLRSSYPVPRPVLPSCGSWDSGPMSPAMLCLCIHLSIYLPLSSPLPPCCGLIKCPSLSLIAPPQGGACECPCVCVSLAGSQCQWVGLYLPHPPPCSFISLSVCLHLCACVSVHELVANPYPLPRGFWNLASGVIFCSLTTLAPMLPPALAPGPPSWAIS